MKAMMEGRDFVIPDDVKALVNRVVPHRVELTSQAKAEEMDVYRLMAEVLHSTPVPK